VIIGSEANKLISIECNRKLEEERRLFHRNCSTPPTAVADVYPIHR